MTSHSHSSLVVALIASLVLAAKAYAAPSATTTAPTNITHDSATLTGVVNAKGAGTNVWFDFGPTTAYGNALYVTYMSSAVPTVVTTVRASLTRHATYHYRVRAETGSTVVRGADVKFIANDFPVAVTDPYTMLPSTKTTLDVLVNDTDGDGDTLAIASYTQPGAAQGTVTKVGNTLVFTAAKTFTGGSFTYIASDAFGGKSVAGVVTLTLGSCMLAPANSPGLAPTAQTISVTVTTPQPWTVVEALPWATVTPTFGTGNGSVTISLTANTSTAARFGDIFIGGVAHHIVQESTYAPTLHVPAMVPHAIVSGTYSLFVPLDTPPANYIVTGLPAGLKMNQATSTIEGIPDAVGADNGTAHVTVKGVAGTTSFDLVVEPLPALAQGSFSALIARDANVSADMGGFVTFTSSKTGVITGTLKIGQITPILTGLGIKHETKVYPINTRLQMPLTGDPTIPTYTITRVGMSPLLLKITVLDITAPGASEVSGSVDLDGTGFSTLLTGRRLAWSTASAAPYVARYTAAFTPPTLTAGTPDGSGYLTMSVAANTAVATWSGQLADGTAYTGSGALWDTGAGTAEVPLWVTLYSSKGALSGRPVITPQSLPDLSTLLGNVSWRKKAQAVRAYKDGFDTSLDVLGTRYLAPAPGSVILGIPAPTLADPNNASISFFDGGVETTLYDNGPIDRSFSISTAHKASFGSGVANPTLMKITSINPTLGTFAGSFTLIKTPGVLSAPAPTTVTRLVPFSGVLLQGASPPQAIGYFLLPASPAVSGDTVSNTAVTSGTATF